MVVTRFSKEAERLKVYQRVFDERTLRLLASLAHRGYFNTLDYPISTGKEADVYRATTKKGGYVAIKIYRITTSNFKAMSRYLIGDSRFKNVRKSRRSIISTWCQKELRNLRDAKKAKVRVPKPIKALENILIMEFIGENGVYAPVLRKTKVKNKTKLIKTIERYIRRMWKDAKIVHGDLSEYNILMLWETPVIIDIGQAMSIKHPIARELLMRDLLNLSRLAKKYKVDFDGKKVYNSLI